MCVCVCVCVYVSALSVQRINLDVCSCMLTYAHVCVCVCVCVYVSALSGHVPVFASVCVGVGVCLCGKLLSFLFFFNSNRAQKSCLTAITMNEGTPATPATQALKPAYTSPLRLKPRTRNQEKHRIS